MITRTNQTKTKEEQTIILQINEIFYKKIPVCPRFFVTFRIYNDK